MFYTIILSALISLTCLSPQDTLANNVEKQVIATLKQGPDSIGRGLRRVSTPEKEAAMVADSIIAYAMQFLGTPYLYGANGPKSFDCTGFTGYVFRRFGIDLSRSSIAQSHDGREVVGDLTALQKGDLVIFGSRRAPAIVGHAGIFIELDSTKRDFTFIHAAHGGVKVTKLSDSYYIKRFKGARRVLPDFNRAVLGLQGSNGAASGADGAGNGLPGADGAENGLPGADGAGNGAAGNQKPLADSLLAAASADSAAGAAIPMIPQVDSTGAGFNQGQAAADSAVYYVVRKGDSLSKIASRNHTTVRRLCELNNITTKTILKIGRRLRIR